MSGVSRSVENWRCWAFLRRTRGKSRRQIFPGCSSSQQMLLLSDMLRVTISSFSRTAHLHIGCVIQSNSCSVKQLISFLQSYGPPTVRTWTPLITRFGDHATACVRDADPQCRRTQAATGWRLERSAAKCCWRCCQRVEKTSAGMCLREARTFRTPGVCCFNKGVELSIDSPCTTCFWIFQ